MVISHASHGTNSPSKFDICLISGFLFNFACVTAQYYPPPSYQRGYPSTGHGGYASSPPPPFGGGYGGYPSPRNEQVVSSGPIKVQASGARYQQDMYRYYGGGYGSGQSSYYQPRPTPTLMSFPRYPGTTPGYGAPPAPQTPRYDMAYRPPMSGGGYGTPYQQPGFGSGGYQPWSGYRGGSYSYPQGYPGYQTPQPYRPVYPQQPMGYPPYQQQPYPPYQPYSPSWRPQNPWEQIDRRQGSSWPGQYPPTYQSPQPSNAEAHLKGSKNVEGTVRFVQQDNRFVGINGRITGLTPGAHGLHIHELANKDKAATCEGIGDHFNPLNSAHGGKSEWVRHTGDLGNVFADNDGIAYFDITDTMITLMGPNSIVNRTLVVTENADDLGKSHHELSKKNGNSGPPLACGTITFASF